MSRRTYEVVPARNKTVEPSSIEEAVDRRHRLQKEVEKLQEQLSEKNRTDVSGRRLDEADYNRWRRTTIAAMHERQQELRDLRAWLGRKQGGKKGSEWALLARAYRILDQLPEGNPDVEQLLDDIEYTIPKAFLESDADSLARTG